MFKVLLLQVSMATVINTLQSENQKERTEDMFSFVYVWKVRTNFFACTQHIMCFPVNSVHYMQHLNLLINHKAQINLGE